jgi:hypothetical protein
MFVVVSTARVILATFSVHVPHNSTLFGSVAQAKTLIHPYLLAV